MNRDYARLAQSKRKAELSNEISEAMYNKDLVYEISKHINLNDLKKLCASNRQYRALYQEERFKKLIQDKIVEQEEDFYDDLLELIEHFGGFDYRINKGDEHSITYGDDDIIESLKIGDYCYGSSIFERLFPDLFPDETGYYKISDPTFEQMEQVLKYIINMPNFNINKFRIGAGSSSKNLREICQEEQYETLCQSKFFRQFEQSLVKKELIDKIRNVKTLVYKKNDHIIEINKAGYEYNVKESFISNNNEDYWDKSILNTNFGAIGRPQEAGKNVWIMDKTSPKTIKSLLKIIINQPEFNINDLEAFE